MKRHLFCVNGSEFADLAFSNASSSPVSICNCKQAYDMGCKPKSRQVLLMKHILKFSKISWFQVLYIGGRGVGNKLYLWFQNSYKHWTEISRKRTSMPKNSIATFPHMPHNCTLSAIYIRLLAPHENKHPLKISTYSSSLVPRRGEGRERVPGTHCLCIRLIATEFRGDRVCMCTYVYQ